MGDWKKTLSPEELGIATALEFSGLFNAEWYLRQYPDVASANVPPLLHYLRHGKNEGRKPNPFFDTSGGFGPAAFPGGAMPGERTSQGIQKPQMTIVFASNERYLPCLSVALTSMAANMSKKYEYLVYVLHDNISPEKMFPLEEVLTDGMRIEAVDVSVKVREIIEHAFISGHVSPETYYRIIIPDLFANLGKCIYLDCDIVVNRPLDDLYETDIDNFLLAAVPETVRLPEIIKRFSALVRNYEEYFNAGVLLINIDNFLKCDISSQFMFWVKSGRRFDTHDQDILNMICDGKTKLLPMTWNYMWQFLAKQMYREAPRKLCGEFFEYYDNPAIVHYNSSYKPWDIDDGRFTAMWWRHAIKSPYLEQIKKNMRLPREYINSLLACE